MSEPIKFSTERDAAITAIGLLEHGQIEEASLILRQALSRRKPPGRDAPERRPTSIIKLRDKMEKALQEIGTNQIAWAIASLRSGLAFVEPV
jgi:hypothetical protein